MWEIIFVDSLSEMTVMHNLWKNWFHNLWKRNMCEIISATKICQYSLDACVWSDHWSSIYRFCQDFQYGAMNNLFIFTFVFLFLIMTNLYVCLKVWLLFVLSKRSESQETTISRISWLFTKHVFFWSMLNTKRKTFTWWCWLFIYVCIG